MPTGRHRLELLFLRMVPIGACADGRLLNGSEESSTCSGGTWSHGWSWARAVGIAWITATLTLQFGDGMVSIVTE